jgi:hypothetical protein
MGYGQLSVGDTPQEKHQRRNPENQSAESVEEIGKEAKIVDLLLHRKRFTNTWSNRRVENRAIELQG